MLVVDTRGCFDKVLKGYKRSLLWDSVVEKAGVVEEDIHAKSVLVVACQNPRNPLLDTVHVEELDREVGWSEFDWSIPPEHVQNWVEL